MVLNFHLALQDFLQSRHSVQHLGIHVNCSDLEILGSFLGSFQTVDPILEANSLREASCLLIFTGPPGMDPKQVQSLTSLSALSAYVTSVVLISGQVKERVTEPYMDEIFHIAQAKLYCKGHWLEWNSKITTPPGLYILPGLLHHLIPNWFSCSTDLLRWINATLLCLLPLLISRILSRFRTTPYPPKPGVKPRVRFLIPEDDIIFEAIVISCFPITYFSGFLFYTDLSSLLAILACYDQSLVGNHIFAALLGLWSCFFRQTNIIWVAFIAGSAWVNRLKHLSIPPSHSHIPKTFYHDDNPEKNRCSTRMYDISLTDASFLDLPKALCDLLYKTKDQFSKIFPVLLPYTAVMACFVAFVLWNRGIVLGDKSNHLSALHIPQFYYFAGFTSIFLAPIILDGSLIKRSIRALLGSSTSLFQTLVLCGLMIWTVDRYTYEHPFLLSDNRHYTFYVWRRIFKMHDIVKYALVPGYLLCWKLILERLARSFTANFLTSTFYIVAITLTLVPSPLIEPRYFLVPYVLLRLHIRPVLDETKTWPIRVFIEGCWYGLVNAITIAVFLYQPFKSPTGEWDGTWQRFMW
ncbi:hypothetical protein O181_005226 [Austropuccinia psidii MF-1]|uniref:Dol-P-Glc:Glc(2)Man(9)GlcNAc(2)-PP-Dol alpha-1,2-glucosyltransferase n=1 Tax=Austropuccinia psidii MF-1 TaxID=1389203 RepID=A0A9Q3BGX1_9BASI|nr:hypothetical protein [Austropuccinia psidii MF-1]